MSKGYSVIIPYRPTSLSEIDPYSAHEIPRCNCKAYDTAGRPLSTISLIRDDYKLYLETKRQTPFHLYEGRKGRSRKNSNGEKFSKDSTLLMGSLCLRLHSLWKPKAVGRLMDKRSKLQPDALQNKKQRQLGRVRIRSRFSISSGHVLRLFYF